MIDLKVVIQIIPGHWETHGFFLFLGVETDPSLVPWASEDAFGNTEPPTDIASVLGQRKIIICV